MRQKPRGRSGSDLDAVRLVAKLHHEKRPTKYIAASSGLKRGVVQMIRAGTHCSLRDPDFAEEVGIPYRGPISADMENAPTWTAATVPMSKLLSEKDAELNRMRRELADTLEARAKDLRQSAG